MSYSFCNLAACTALALSTLSSQADAQALVSRKGTDVTVRDIEALAAAYDSAARAVIYANPANVKRQAEDMAVRRAMAADAESSGLHNDPVVAAQLRQARERVLSEAMLAAADLKATPDDAALTKYAQERYRLGAAAYITTEQVRIRHILLRLDSACTAPSKAQSLLKQLKEGANFEALAQTHSADVATAKSGGDLGWLEPKVLGAALQKAIDALKSPGDISEVVESSVGLHILKLEGRKPAAQMTFEEAKGTIQREVLAKMRTEARKKLIDPLTAELVRDEQALAALAARMAKP